MTRIRGNLSEPPFVSVVTGVGCGQNQAFVPPGEGSGHALLSALFGPEVLVWKAWDWPGSAARPHSCLRLFLPVIASCADLSNPGSSAVKNSLVIALLCMSRVLMSSAAFHGSSVCIPSSLLGAGVPAFAPTAGKPEWGIQTDTW